MSEPADVAEPPYHLILDDHEIPQAAHALRLLISDEAHEPEIRRLAREVLAELGRAPDERGVLTVALAPQQMKITHSAARLLLNDLQREQADEREILQRILAKLPDEHTMRAIEIA
jgi:CheY-like chemotaxis protein